MGKQIKSYVFYVGVAAFAIGLLLKSFFPEANGAMQSLSFVLIGFGSGIIGVGIASLWRQRTLKDHPEKVKQMEIDEKDERNVRLREKAGYATWYVTMFVLAALSMAFVVMDLAIACWLTLGALFVHIISFFVCIGRYNKKM